MTTVDGKKIEIIDDEKIPLKIITDKKTGKKVKVKKNKK